MKHTLVGIALAVLLTLSSAVGQQSITRLDGSTITAAEIDWTMTRLMKAAEVTGVGIAILNHGKVAYLKAYGFRDKEKNLPLTVDSVMSAASISKVAFGYLAMELVDDGVLDLDKPVYQVFAQASAGISEICRPGGRSSATSALRRACC